MKHLSWVTNIPTPYRNHRYETMREVFPEYGLTFEVLYMAWTEPGRHWEFTSDDLHYPHRVLPGRNVRVNGVNLYTNPRLLAHVRRSAPDIVVVGGFSAPTLLAAPLVCPSSTVRLLAVESNNASARYNKGVVHRLKRSAVRRYDGFVVPGQASREYIEQLHPEASSKPFVFLPNIVDRRWLPDVAFGGEGADGLRLAYGADSGSQLWLCVARLETFKGLAEFLPLMRGLDDVQLVIAGEGSQRSQLEEMIRSQDLPVHLVGHLDEGRLHDLYAAADLFVLPSLQDASPLAAVEAAASGLPLVMTWQIGNSRDLISDTDNGWIIDTADSNGTREILKFAAEMSRTELAQHGRKSLALYNSRFESEAAIRRLADEIAALASP